MLRHGPLTLWLHGMFEYAAALACFATPFLFDFQTNATRWSIIAGLAFVVVALTIDGPRAVTDRLPIVAHVVLDWLLAIALVLSPFVLDLDGHPAATRFFVALGVLHALVTIGTRFAPPARAHVGSLAASTSTDVAAGERTVVD